jgi:hypothetical protein
MVMTAINSSVDSRPSGELLALLFRQQNTYFGEYLAKLRFKSKMP